MAARLYEFLIKNPQVGVGRAGLLQAHHALLGLMMRAHRAGYYPLQFLVLKLVHQLGQGSAEVVPNRSAPGAQPDPTHATLPWGPCSLPAGLLYCTKPRMSLHRRRPL